MILIQKFQFNPFPVNSFVVADTVSKTCAIIDPGCYWEEEVAKLREYIALHGFKVKYILQTHLHIDHVMGIAWVKEMFPEATFCANSRDAFLMDNAAAHAMSFGLQLPAELLPIEKDIDENEPLMLGDEKIIVLAVPGHSPGSLCYYFESAKSIIVGDVLFRQSIGRTDLPGGNHSQLLENIERKLFSLPDEITVYPGHGPETTIGNEKRINPFF